MLYSVKDIAAIIDGRFLQSAGNAAIAHLVYDSRKIQFADTSLFFALRTERSDGHQFLLQAYKKGIRNFVVDHDVDVTALADCNIIVVKGVLKSLQQLAAYHRRQFSIPVIGITGSNGKTIVKEWLNELLQDDENIIRSPKSFNSQIGVPLSVWQLNEHHTLGIFEAGISQPGEMEQLAAIIQPTIGVLTNIGAAHDEGFESREQKLAEKAKLFQNADVLIAPYNILKTISLTIPTISWGREEKADVRIIAVSKEKEETSITLLYNGKEQHFKIPFTDDASIENAISCCCVALYLKKDFEKVAQRFATLHAVDMRLHLMEGVNNCTLVNDSYSADLTSLAIALVFLQQQYATQKRTVILSDFFESGMADEELYKQIAQSLQQYDVQRVIGIGEKIAQYLPHYLSSNIYFSFYHSTEDFVRAFRGSIFKDEIILIKGARKFGFESIVQHLEYKVHQTQLEINLNAIVHNLKQYQNLLKPQTKVMAMVKAFAYGSGGAEIAGVLQYHNVNYLGVAYVDEGVELRKSGITLPVMVLNVDETSFQAVVDYNLEPVIYSFKLLQHFSDFINKQGLQYYPVHIEVETGMNRLGFAAEDVEKLSQILASSSLLKVESMFSHLAASEDAAQDEYTARQAAILNKAVAQLSAKLSYPFIKHISNSAAIIRHPQLQMDMVRLGIGLYGVEIETHKLELQPVATLRSTIAQLKHLHKGDTVSYNRRGVVDKEALIATVRIGYADGYTRHLGNGVGKMLVNGKVAPVIGTVCMDMTMIDVTDVVGVKEGDEVIVFGNGLPVQTVARWAGTISYEIMTSVSQRVKRIYFQE